MIRAYEPNEPHDDFHAVTTITLGELLTEGGIDWTQPQWAWRDDAYNNAQYARCCRKIENRYYDRELGVMPPSRWRRHLMRLITEFMPVLKPLYQLADGHPGIFLADADTRCALCSRTFQRRSCKADRITQAMPPTHNMKPSSTAIS